MSGQFKEEMTVTTTAPNLAVGAEGWLASGEEGWNALIPGAGSVLEIKTPAGPWELADEGLGAALVTANDTSDPTGVIDTRMNRKGQKIHLCGSDPCSYGGDAEIIHVYAAKPYLLKEFQADYMKAWGKKVLADFGKAQEEGQDPFATLRRKKGPEKPEGKEVPPKSRRGKEAS